MKVRIGCLVLAGFLVVGCRRHEEKSAGPAAGMPAGHGSASPRKPAVIEVPDAIKARWKAGRFSVVDTSTKKTVTLTAEVGKATPIPGTDLTLKLEALVPDFSMGNGVITSKSDKLGNPAAKASISEGGAERFNGWFFSMFPEAHPFEHPKYQIRLVSFVPAEGAH